MPIDREPVRLRGRPPKLSSERIIEAASEVLSEVAADEFTLGKVAEHLGAPVTSVYNYFPNRFALLSALAETLFTGFKFEEPPAKTAWPDAIMAWLRAVDAFFLKHPVAIKAIGTDDQVSPAWGLVRAPLLKQLRRAGFKGRDLAAVALAVHSQLIGLLFMASYALRPQPADGVFPPSNASQTEHDEAELRSHRKAIDREEIIGFGLMAIVRQLKWLAQSRAR
ncbi:MAG TPA: TetR/AcrR family transcriptional regulator [Alphaproteobacteria bacterium]|nr:TetR/AcrR family transcriptional regulator [Alphaproteobacteria bacterium]